MVEGLQIGENGQTANNFRNQPKRFQILRGNILQQIVGINQIFIAAGCVTGVNGYDAVIVPGSIKSVRQILECARIPVYGVAVAGDVFDGMLDNIVVDNAVDKFNSDFADLVGKGKTYLDLV